MPDTHHATAVTSRNVEGETWDKALVRQVHARCLPSKPQSSTSRVLTTVTLDAPEQAEVLLACLTCVTRRCVP